MTAFEPGHHIPIELGISRFQPTSSFVTVIMGVGFGASPADNTIGAGGRLSSVGAALG